MGYDPHRLVCSWPPYRSKRRGLLYGLKPWIGFDIWHLDPQKRSKGQRTDDSCGWFDRRPGPYADAVAYILRDENTMHEIARAIRMRDPVTGPYGHTYPRLPLSECLAIVLLVADELELRRWWNGQNGKGGAHASWIRKTLTRSRDVNKLARWLALSPIDNLSAVDDPEKMVNLIAGALHREFRPWWKHPKWHVHHWEVKFDLASNVRRMFERCATCHKRLGFGYCPTSSGGKLHHGECLGINVSDHHQPASPAS